MKLRIACVGSRALALSEMIPYQGELKTLTEDSYKRLRKEIEETGYAFPIRVWMDPSDECWKIIGGHQTHRVLTQMQAEGWDIPESIPVTEIMAESFKEAKRRVLQDASNYGSIERQGLYQFMTEADFGPADLAVSFDLPEINVPSFNAEFFLDRVTGRDTTPEERQAFGISEPKMKDGSTEYTSDDFSKDSFKHECPRCGFNFD